MAMRAPVFPQETATLGFGGFFGHGDGADGVPDFANPREFAALGNERFDLGLVSVENKADPLVFGRRHSQTTDNGTEAAVSAHHIHRYDYPVCVGILRAGFQRNPPFCSVLGRVFVQIDFFDHVDDFLLAVVTARTTHVVRTLEFTAVAALIRVSCNQRIMCATHAAFGACNFTLWDCHVVTLTYWS